ncbi:MAG: copper resistance protein NlpE N-terminal domain-containing protein [Ginsengibacter sp.]
MPSGKYAGVTPCADCPGIKTTIYIKDDSTFIENLEYLDREVSFSDTGTWKVVNKIVTVSFPSHKSYFRILSDSSIAILDAERRQIKGILSEKFILKQQR